jgi:hypothetical protein
MAKRRDHAPQSKEPDKRKHVGRNGLYVKPGDTAKAFKLIDDKRRDNQITPFSGKGRKVEKRAVATADVLKYLLPAVGGGGLGYLLSDDEDAGRNALLGALAGGAGAYGMDQLGGWDMLSNALYGQDTTAPDARGFAGGPANPGDRSSDGAVGPTSLNESQPSPTSERLAYSPELVAELQENFSPAQVNYFLENMTPQQAKQIVMTGNIGKGLKDSRFSTLDNVGTMVGANAAGEISRATAEPLSVAALTRLGLGKELAKGVGKKLTSAAELAEDVVGIGARNYKDRHFLSKIDEYLAAVDNGQIDPTLAAALGNDMGVDLSPEMMQRAARERLTQADGMLPGFKSNMTVGLPAASAYMLGLPKYVALNTGGNFLQLADIIQRGQRAANYDPSISKMQGVSEAFMNHGQAVSNAIYDKNPWLHGLNTVIHGAKGNPMDMVAATAADTRGLQQDWAAQDRSATARQNMAGRAAVTQDTQLRDKGYAFSNPNMVDYAYKAKNPNWRSHVQATPEQWQQFDSDVAAIEKRSPNQAHFLRTGQEQPWYTRWYNRDKWRPN